MKKMTVREILKQAGIISRLTNWCVLAVSKSESDHRQFTISWVSDYDGAGPEYTFTPGYGVCDDDPEPHYSIPETGTPPDWKEHVDLDEEGWDLDQDSIMEVEHALKKIQVALDIIKENQLEENRTILCNQNPVLRD